MIHPIRRRDLLSLVIILIIAAVMRLSNLGISEFWYDEATLSTLAQNLAAGKALPLLGIPSSAHIPNSPASVYVVALPYLASNSPLFAVGFIAVLNIIGVGLLWLLVHRYFGATIAILSSLTYAISPWAVLFSRKIWEQDFHTPIFLAGLLLGFYGFIEGKRWAQLLCLPVLVFALQIHFAALPLLILFLWLTWIGRRRISGLAMGISVVLALLTLVPFGLGLYQTHTEIPLQTDKPFAGLQPLPLLHAVWLTTGLGLENFYALPPQADLVAQNPLIGTLWIALLVSSAIGVLALWKQSRSWAVLLLLWACVPILLLVSGWKQSEVHYYIASIPAYCLLIGAGVEWLGRKFIRFRLLIYGVLGLILTAQVVNWYSFLSFVDTTYVPRPGFNTPIHYLMEIRAQLKNDVLIFPGSDTQSGYTVWSPLLYQQATCVREALIAEGGIAVFPQGSFSVLHAPDALPSEFSNLYDSAPSLTVPLRSGEGSYTIQQVEQPLVWTGPKLTPIQPARFDNGISLDDYTFSNQRLYLEWTLPGQSTQDYQYFAHVLNGAGDKLAQHDASFWPGKYWCANDRIVTWIDLGQPVHAVTLRIGMYRLDHGAITGDNVVNDTGADSPWVDIPLTSAAGA